MEQRAGFTNITVQSAVLDITGLIFGAFAAATAVAVVAMGIVLVVAT